MAHKGVQLLQNPSAMNTENTHLTVNPISLLPEFLDPIYTYHVKCHRLNVITSISINCLFYTYKTYWVYKQIYFQFQILFCLLYMYRTDHAQRPIRLRSWVCLRLNNCWGRGHSTCFARECTSPSVLRDIHEWNRCHALFWAIIKPRANPQVQASATLCKIGTVAQNNLNHTIF